MPALYQDKDVFDIVHVGEYKKNPAVWSPKACWFDDLDAAKAYIQMARDEEGVLWNWPDTIPVLWKTGPLTQMDLETFPGFEEVLLE